MTLAGAASAREYAQRYGEDGQAQRERALKQLEGTGYEELVMQGLQAEQNSAYREKAAAFLESFMKGEYIPDVQLGELWQSAQAWKRQRTQAGNRQDTAVQTAGANTAREGLNLGSGTAYNESIPDAAEGLTVGESLTEGKDYASAGEMLGERAEGTGGRIGYDYLDAQLGSLKDKVKINSYESSESVNAFWKRKKYAEPPYTPKTTVQNIELLEDTFFVRVYNGTDTGMYGGWIMRAEDIVGLTPKEIQKKYALPYEPIYVAEVKILAGNNVNMGTANGLFGYKGGGIQFDLKGQQIGEFTELGKIIDWRK